MSLQPDQPTITIPNYERVFVDCTTYNRFFIAALRKPYGCFYVEAPEIFGSRDGGRSRRGIPGGSVIEEEVART